MIVISPSRGDGIVSVGGEVVLFDGEYARLDHGSAVYFALLSGGSAVGAEVAVSGPGSWTWLLDGAAANFQVYCQPKSGSVRIGSSPTNSWVSLGTDRNWRRAPGRAVVLAISIRDAATGTVLATCTITLNEDD